MAAIHAADGEDALRTGIEQGLQAARAAARASTPAVDVAASNTRKDELIMAPDEAAVVNKLRRLLAALDSQQAIDLLISQLKKTQNNIEFLMTVQKNSGFGDND